MSFEDGWASFKQKAGPLLVGELAQQAPVGKSNDPFSVRDSSGTLSQSMEWKSGPNGELDVGSTDSRAWEYGGVPTIVIRGSRPHPIDPVNALFLHFWTDDGDEVFTKHVDHPGTQPNPFNRAAWDAQRPAILRMFRDTVPHATLVQLNPWRDRTIVVGR